jgi:hypothetical protein
MKLGFSPGEAEHTPQKRESTMMPVRSETPSMDTAIISTDVRVGQSFCLELLLTKRYRLARMGHPREPKSSELRKLCRTSPQSPAKHLGAASKAAPHAARNAATHLPGLSQASIRGRRPSFLPAAALPTKLTSRIQFWVGNCKYEGRKHTKMEEKYPYLFTFNLVTWTSMTL